MCNCGKKRSQLRPQLNTLNNSNIQQVQRPVYEAPMQTLPAQIKRTIVFQYTGRTALTITGSITRKNYRFNFPGDIQSIDSKDAAAMTAVPVLKRM